MIRSNEKEKTLKFGLYKLSQKLICTIPNLIKKCKDLVGMELSVPDVCSFIVSWVACIIIKPVVSSNLGILLLLFNLGDLFSASVSSVDRNLSNMKIQILSSSMYELSLALN